MVIRKKFSNTFILITSMLSFLITIFNYTDISKGYNLIIIFPIVFMFSYILTLGQLNINKSRNPVTIYMFLILQWLRYVLTPIMISLSGERAGTAFLNPTEQSLHLATMLMILDIIINFLILFYLSRRKKYLIKIKILV